MTAGLNKENVVAIVTESGGMTSHSAILARALEIPAVLSVQQAVATLKDGSFVIVDGINGQVICAAGSQKSEDRARNLDLADVYFHMDATDAVGMYEKAMELVISNTENLYVKNLINIHKKELNDFCQVKNIKL